jgi:hypothetical protein
MLQWIQMGAKEQQWAEQANLGGLFVVYWIIPQLNLLEPSNDILHFAH